MNHKNWYRCTPIANDVMVQEAKADSDAFLTELIKQEQSKSSEGGAGKQSQSTPDSKTRKKDKLQSGSTGTPEENAPQVMGALVEY